MKTAAASRRSKRLSPSWACTPTSTRTGSSRSCSRRSCASTGQVSKRPDHRRQQMQPAHLEMLREFCGADHPVVILPPGASVKVKRRWTVSSVIDRPGCEPPGTPIEQLADTSALAGLLQRVEPALRAFDADQRDSAFFLPERMIHSRTGPRSNNGSRNPGGPSSMRRTCRMRDRWALSGMRHGRCDWRRGGVRPRLRTTWVANRLAVPVTTGSSAARGGALAPRNLPSVGTSALVLPGKHRDSHPVWPLYVPFRIERGQLTSFLERLESL